MENKGVDKPVKMVLTVTHQYGAPQTENSVDNMNADVKHLRLPAVSKYTT